MKSDIAAVNFAGKTVTPPPTISNELIGALAP
jgi:hypothetical protein